MSFLRSTSLVVSFAATALAHGGHEAVPDGEAISLEPIVCSSHLSICLVPYKAGGRPLRSIHLSRTMLIIEPSYSSGLHTMGSYDSHGLFIRHYLPLGHGPGCMLLPFPFFLPSSQPSACTPDPSTDQSSPRLRSSAPAGTSPSKSSEP